jgi:micrococcal nuclease
VIPGVRTGAIPSRSEAMRRNVRRAMWLLALILGSQLWAQDDFSGRVVSIIDGDTIGVMRNGREVRIRLEGIDCPENGQDFTTRAK